MCYYLRMLQKKNLDSSWKEDISRTTRLLAFSIFLSLPFFLFIYRSLRDLGVQNKLSLALSIFLRACNDYPGPHFPIICLLFRVYHNWDSQIPPRRKCAEENMAASWDKISLSTYEKSRFSEINASAVKKMLTISLE